MKIFTIVIFIMVIIFVPAFALENNDIDPMKIIKKIDDHNKETKEDAQIGIIIASVAGIFALIVAGLAILKANYDKKELTDFIAKNESDTLKFITKTEDGIKEFITKTRYLQEGSIYFNTKDWKNAIKYYELYLKLEPNDVRVLHNIGASYGHLEKWADAIPVFDKVLKSLSVDKEVRAAASNNIGLCYTQLSDYDNALKYFEESYTIDPKHADTISNLGYHYLDKLQMPEKAIEYYDKIINEKLLDGKELADVYADKAKSLCLIGNRYSDALEICNKALILDDKNVKALIQKSNTLFNLHQYGNAILCADIVLNIDPSIDTMLLAKANALMELGFLIKAIIVTNQYIQRHPDVAESYSNIGSFLARSDAMGLASVFFEESVKIDPNSFKNYANLATCYTFMEMYSTALPFFEKAYEIKSDNVGFLLDMGQCLEKLKKHKESIVYCYRRILQLDRYNVLAYKRLEKAFKQIDDKQASQLASDISYEIGIRDDV